jgi:hypothetical protein
MNPPKLGLHFSDFSKIFYGIYKIQQITSTIWEPNFAQAPGKISDSQAYPQIADEPLALTWSSQLGLPGRPAAVRPKFRRAGGAGGRGKGGEVTRESPRLDLGARLGKKWRPAGWTAAPDGGQW